MTYFGKAILINPFAKTVSQVPYEYGGSYKQISDYIATPEAPKPLFTSVDVSDHDYVYVDDEGLYRDTQAFFFWKGYPQPLQGFGLVLGCDDEGETVPPQIDLTTVSGLVSFPAGISVKPRFVVEHFRDPEEMIKAMME